MSDCEATYNKLLAENETYVPLGWWHNVVNTINCYTQVYKVTLLTVIP
jgi:hypothetical protein